jgi:hypothetical protein
LGKDPQERLVFFYKNFNKLNQDPALAVGKKGKELLDILRKEMLLIQKGQADGKSTTQVYNEIGTSDELWRILTDPAYRNLSLNNYDHFAPGNKIAYSVGHQEALRTA